MKIKLELNQLKVEQKLKTSMNGLVMKITESINGDVNRAGVVPYDRGDLQSTSFVKMLGESQAEIHYPQPYAVKMWYGEEYNFQKGHNSNATHHWALPYMDKKRLQAYAKAFLKMKGW